MSACVFSLSFLHDFVPPFLIFSGLNSFGRLPGRLYLSESLLRLPTMFPVLDLLPPLVILSSSHALRKIRTALVTFTE